MKKKDIATAIILSIVTCGIYSLIWFVNLTDDAKALADDKEMQTGGMALLLTIVTCGIYGFYWAYKMGLLLKTAQGKRGLTPKDNEIIYLVLQFFGLGIVNYALMQSDINDMIK